MIVLYLKTIIDMLFCTLNVAKYSTKIQNKTCSLLMVTHCVSVRALKQTCRYATISEKQHIQSRIKNGIYPRKSCKLVLFYAN